MFGSERNVRRLLASFDDSVAELRAVHPQITQFHDELRGAVTLLMEEACIANQDWMTVQLNQIMERHGLPYTAWSR